VPSLELVDDASIPDVDQSWYMPNDALVEALEREVLAEIGPEHDLYGCRLTVIARCPARDDVAFRIDDGRYAIVHLRWKRRREPAPWPSTQIF
jgi:hypothetical protein